MAHGTGLVPRETQLSDRTHVACLHRSYSTMARRVSATHDAPAPCCTPVLRCLHIFTVFVLLLLVATCRLEGGCVTPRRLHPCWKDYQPGPVPRGQARQGSVRDAIQEDRPLGLYPKQDARSAGASYGEGGRWALGWGL